MSLYVCAFGRALLAAAAAVSPQKRSAPSASTDLLRVLSTKCPKGFVPNPFPKHPAGQGPGPACLEEKIALKRFASDITDLEGKILTDGDYQRARAWAAVLDVNKHHDGMTVLMRAARQGQAAVVTFLVKNLNARADFRIGGATNCSATDYAVHGARTEHQNRGNLDEYLKVVTFLTCEAEVECSDACAFMEKEHCAAAHEQNDFTWAAVRSDSAAPHWTVQCSAKGGGGSEALAVTRAAPRGVMAVAGLAFACSAAWLV
uniref:Uncharacterized protein n=1 Tax=Zooxanthella nutricula TaxID=1333877 RepID=A0A6U6NRH0_9DINO|mmetsp:Transcript_51433/g.156312  ORF Transcript_51433/g.156312 Transcript_51433/m.156312 type:complete len:260 (+) Transcript_51433:65-844(+)|eukprot:CAMPEP_0198543428 /NCGR_PEP_ID=MMETSP1462-20131121/59660_1 /TAXON_ID=1333877 /ORGANISM="Brandtodinium nutriculum, Strain RCC3387" /LENGTH=259 /DNA_ID=CAMNT_0044273703 /DNA_START=65 /DNA_END=844 /DNA_ORIENTATION=+